MNDIDIYLKNFIPTNLLNTPAFMNFAFVNRKDQPLYQFLEIYLKKDLIQEYPHLDYAYNEAIEIRMLEEQILLQAFCASYEANFNDTFSKLNSLELRDIKAEIGKNKIVELITEHSYN